MSASLSSSAQLPFYSTSTATLPPDLLMAVEALTGITTSSMTPPLTPITTEEPIISEPLPALPLASVEYEAVPKLAPPQRRKTTQKNKNKVSFTGSKTAQPSRMAMRLVSEPVVADGVWPDEVPLAQPAWQQRVQGKARSQWLRSAVVLSVLATRSVVNAFVDSEPWVYKALQTTLVSILCFNLLLACINVGHQLTMAMVQRPYAEQLAIETQTRHHEIEQSLIALKKGEGLEVLARSYMDMVEPTQVLVKVH